MESIVRSVFLSDFMIFLIMGALLMLATSWAFRLNERAGYILGWLIGVFFIIVVSVILPPTEPPVGDQPLRLSVVQVLLPSLLGGALGFGMIMLTAATDADSTRAGRALTVAVIVGSIISGWYIIILSDTAFRLTVAIAGLAFAIGALFAFILTRRAAYRQVANAANYPTTNPDMDYREAQIQGAVAEHNEENPAVPDYPTTGQPAGRVELRSPVPRTGNLRNRMRRGGNRPKGGPKF